MTTETSMNELTSDGVSMTATELRYRTFHIDMAFLMPQT